MSKTTATLTVLCLFLFISCVTLFIESGTVTDVRQIEIDYLKKQNQKERERFETELQVTRDSLNVAFETIRQANKERQEAHERTQRIIRNYEKIIFVALTDSSRNSELKKLYKSF